VVPHNIIINTTTTLSRLVSSRAKQIPQEPELSTTQKSPNPSTQQIWANETKMAQPTGRVVWAFFLQEIFFFHLIFLNATRHATPRNNTFRDPMSIWRKISQLNHFLVATSCITTPSQITMSASFSLTSADWLL
jgi:hypothetical protein